MGSGASWRRARIARRLRRRSTLDMPSAPPSPAVSNSSSLGSPSGFDALMHAVQTDNARSAVALVGARGVDARAAIFASVKLGAATVVRELLQAGAPANFLAQDIPHAQQVWQGGLDKRGTPGSRVRRGAPPDGAAAPAPLVATQRQLSEQGVSADGILHMTPLLIAVRQQNPDTTAALLAHGASPVALCAGKPPLVHLAEAVAATQSWAPAPQLGRSMQVLHALLAHGADPFAPSLAGGGSPPTTFLLACPDPAMLRLAVQHVLALARAQGVDLLPEQSSAACCPLGIACGGGCGRRPSLQGCVHYSRRCPLPPHESQQPLSLSALANPSCSAA